MAEMTIESLPRMLANSVQTHASRTALLDPNGAGGYDAWTYAQLWRDVRRVAWHLDEIGVRRNEKVGLVAESRAWWPITDFAVMGLGAVVVPVYPSLTAPQVSYIVNQSEMRGVFLQNLKQLSKLLELPADAMPGLEFVVFYEEPTGDHAQGLLIEAAKRWRVERFEPWRLGDDEFSLDDWEARYADLTRADLATIVYTSGTTGNPKGTMLTHGNLLSNVEGTAEIVQVRTSDRSLSYLPLSHIFERTAGQFIPFAVGASIAYSRGMDHITEDFVRMPPTVLTTVPRLLEKVQEQVIRTVDHGGPTKRRLFEHAVACGKAARVNHKHVAKWHLALYDRLVFEKIRAALGGHVRMIVSGGAPLPPYVGEFFASVGVTVVEGYGMTETSPVIAVNRPEAPRIGMAGQVLSNVQARIAEDGELLVRGPSITPGYYRDEVATAEALTEDGWLRTGDIGELTDDGYLRITDRKKSLIILSTGKKVVPAAVEADILKDPFVDQVLLLGQNRKYVTAIVVPNADMLKSLVHSTSRGTPAGSRGAGGQGTPAGSADSKTSATDAGRQISQASSNGALAELLLKRIQEDTAEFARFEQPKKVLVVDEPFSVENGLLTPTLKVRARDVTKRYAAEIDEMYGE